MAEDLQKAIDSAKVVFFELIGCPFCAKAENALKEAGIDFTKVPIGEHRAELINKTGKSSAPSVWIRGVYVGGCNDGSQSWMGVIPMLKSGKFQEMINNEASNGTTHPTVGYANADVAKAPGPPIKGKGKGAPVGKGGAGKAPGLSYKERQALELAAKEEELSAEQGFAGKELNEQEKTVILNGKTDQEEGPYGGKKFMPSRGYFACKACGNILYMHQSKFVH